MTIKTPTHDETIAAHRFIYPFPEVSAAILTVFNTIQDGRAKAYRNNRDGGLMLAYVCNTCDTHHGLIELHSVRETNVLDSERFFTPVRRSVPYVAYLSRSNQFVHLCAEDYAPAAGLISKLSQTAPRSEPMPLPRVLDVMPDLMKASMEGGTTLSLDRLTGRTVVSLDDGESDGISPLFSVRFPGYVDMRDMEDFTSLGTQLEDVFGAMMSEHVH